MWDGEYKKMNFDSLARSSEAKKAVTASYIADLEKGPAWKASDGAMVTFAQGIYEISSDTVSDTGNYTAEDFDRKPYIQFRSKNENGYFKGSYYVSYAPLQNEQVSSSTKNKNTQPQIQYNYDSIILQPYAITLEGSYAVEGRPIILTRSAKKE